MDGGNIPSPNFSQDNSGFLQFSSTPIEGKNFKPKWGKRNRQDNWNRFGNQNQSQEGESPVTPSGPHRGGWRGHGGGGGGGWRGGGRGGGGGGGYYRGRGGGGFNNSWQGGGGGRGGGGRWNNSPHHHNQSRGGGHHQQQQQDGGWFHPGMLEDPWAELEAGPEDTVGGYSYNGHGGWEEAGSFSGPGGAMSESMIAQVGDTLGERHERLLDNTEAETETSSSTGVTQGNESTEDVVVEQEQTTDNSQ